MSFGDPADIRAGVIHLYPTRNKVSVGPVAYLLCGVGVGIALNVGYQEFRSVRPGVQPQANIVDTDLAVRALTNGNQAKLYATNCFTP